MKPTLTFLMGLRLALRRGLSLWTTHPNHRPVPTRIPRPGAAPGSTCFITPQELPNLAEACRIASRVRALAGSLCVPEAAVEDIDRICHEAIIAENAFPTPLGYSGFPASICLSINEELCHGIPLGERRLVEGDIVSIDVSVFKNGFHGDCCGSFVVGKVDSTAEEIVQVSREATYAGISKCVPGAVLSESVDAINDLANQHMFSVNQYFSGHGLGKELHLWPIIGYARGDGSNVVLKSGMVFTVEPIIMELGHEHYVKEDGWTAVSKDGGRCAQHEEAILVTDQGPVVLTSH